MSPLFPRHVDGLVRTIQSDLARLGGDTGLTAFLKGIIRDRAFRAVCTFRLEAAASKGPTRPLYWIAHVAHTVSSSLAGLDLPSETTIGPGLRVFHGRGLVINGASRLGSNVSLFGGVTIGRRDRIDPDGSRRTLGAPTIGDNVWIGPNAIVVGPVTVGEGARIAGGATVFRDLEPRCIFAGNPGAVVRANAPIDVMYPASLPMNPQIGNEACVAE